MEEGAYRTRKVMKERNKLVLRGGQSHRKMCAFQLETNETHLDTLVESRAGRGK